MLAITSSKNEFLLRSALKKQIISLIFSHKATETNCLKQKS